MPVTVLQRGDLGHPTHEAGGRAGGLRDIRLRLNVTPLLIIGYARGVYEGSDLP